MNYWRLEFWNLNIREFRFLEFGNLLSDVCMFSFRMVHCSFSMFNLLVYSTGSSSLWLRHTQSVDYSTLTYRNESSFADKLRSRTCIHTTNNPHVGIVTDVFVYVVTVSFQTFGRRVWICSYTRDRLLLWSSIREMNYSMYSNCFGCPKKTLSFVLKINITNIKLFLFKSKLWVCAFWHSHIPFSISQFKISAPLGPHTGRASRGHRTSCGRRMHFARYDWSKKKSGVLPLQWDTVCPFDGAWMDWHTRTTDRHSTRGYLQWTIRAGGMTIEALSDFFSSTMEEAQNFEVLDISDARALQAHTRTRYGTNKCYPNGYQQQPRQ